MKKYYWIPYVPIIGIFSTWLIPSKYDMCIDKSKHFYLATASQVLAASIITAIIF